MGTTVSQITSLTIVYSTVYSGADQRKHQSYASMAFVRGIHRWPVTSPHNNAENISIRWRHHDSQTVGHKLALLIYSGQSVAKSVGENW